MIRRCVLSLVAILAVIGLAQAQEAAPKRHHHKGAPAVDKTAAPQEEPPLPEKVQKWFGNTVDDILTGADKTLGGDEK